MNRTMAAPSPGRVLLSTALLIVCLMFVVSTPEPASGDSGIDLTKEIAAPPFVEPPWETRQITAVFCVANTNDVCDENVFVDLQSFSATPSGAAQFVGFARDPVVSGHQQVLDYVLEDESGDDLYCTFQTGENAGGCDFSTLTARIRVRDFGPTDWDDCDAGEFHTAKGEPPGPWFTNLVIEADPGPPPSGTGRIYGVVVRDQRTRHASIVIQKSNSCVPGGPDNFQQYYRLFQTSTNDNERGFYECTDLPAGVYTVTAILDEATQSKPGISIDPNNPMLAEQEVLFLFP